MSSDGYFDSDGLDGDAFEALDAIEAAALLPPAKVPNHRVKTPEVITAPSAANVSVYDLTFEIDENDLEKLDGFIEDAYQGKAQPVAGFSRTNSAKHQTTLFGDILPSPTLSTKPRSRLQKTKSVPRSPFEQQPPKTKQWDHTAFAKSGLKRGNAKGKRKMTNDDEEKEESDVEFEQFPAPFISRELSFCPSSTIP